MPLSDVAIRSAKSAATVQKLSDGGGLIAACAAALTSLVSWLWTRGALWSVASRSTASL